MRLADRTLKHGGSSSANDCASLQEMFESARGFVLLEWSDPDEDPEYAVVRASEWFAVPLLNQSSWAVALVRMALDTNPSHRRIAQSCGHVALVCCQGGLEVFENRQPPFPAFGMENSPRMFEGTDLLSYACSYTVHVIAETDRLLEDSISGGCCCPCSVGCKISRGWDLYVSY
jgi:hypothetical protein